MIEIEDENQNKKEFFKALVLKKLGEEIDDLIEDNVIILASVSGYEVIYFFYDNKKKIVIIDQLNYDLNTAIDTTNIEKIAKAITVKIGIEKEELEDYKFIFFKEKKPVIHTFSIVSNQFNDLFLGLILNP